MDGVNADSLLRWLDGAKGMLRRGARGGIGRRAIGTLAAAETARLGRRGLAGSRVGGADWFDTRPYGAGDELRAVDWRVYGRSDRLVVRRREEAGRRSVGVVLDVSASMGVGGGEKWPAAVRAALGAAWMAGQGGGVVRVGVLRGGRVESAAARSPGVPPLGFSGAGGGGGGWESVATGLAGVEPGGEAGLTAWMDGVGRNEVLTGEVVLVSDLREAQAGVLTALAGLGLAGRFRVLRVLGAGEVEGPMMSRGPKALELVDAETGRRRRVRSGEWAAAYQRAVAADRAVWRTGLMGLGAEFGEVVAAGTRGEVVRGLLGLAG
ncbi:MAG: DUF58 domain-containing protein [Planctomycetota bacterium]